MEGHVEHIVLWETVSPAVCSDCILHTLANAAGYLSISCRRFAYCVVLEDEEGLDDIMIVYLLKGSIMLYEVFVQQI